MNRAKIRLDGENLITQFEGDKVNVLPIIQIREIKDNTKRKMKLAEYIYLRGIEENKTYLLDNDAHRRMCLFESNILGVHVDELLVSCALWAHHYDYAPDEQKEVTI